MSAAVLSECGTYRYSLTREWECDDDLRIVWVMLNPSVADAEKNDPTIRKIIWFSKWWRLSSLGRRRFSSLEVVNLWAYRATEPAAMAAALDPVGPENDYYIQLALSRADMVVAAWGASYPPKLALRPHKIGKHLRERGAHVLGLTKAGDPRHPLYMPNSTEPERWSS